MEAMKMNARKWIAVAAAAMVVGGGAYVARAQAPGAGHPGGPGARLGAFVQKLNLTQEQREQIRKAVGAHLPEFKESAKKMMEARGAVLDKMSAEPLDEAAIREACRKAETVAEDVAVQRARLIAELRPILTAEQRATVNEGLQHLREGRGDRLDMLFEFIQQRIEAKSGT
jgi:Spy/CpxP family protein refolding chaperone